MTNFNLEVVMDGVMDNEVNKDFNKVEYLCTLVDDQ